VIARLRCRIRHPQRRLLLGVTAGVVAGVSAGIGVHAFMDAFTTNSLGLTSGSVNAEGALSTPVVSGRDVTVSWPADTLSDGTPTTYYVLRDSSGAAGSCAGIQSAATSSCTDTAVPSGTHTYTVVPTYLMWTGASATVTSPAVGTAALSLSPSSTTTLPASTTASVTNFIDNETITFRLDDASTGTALSSTPSTVTTGASGGAASPSVTIPANIAGGAHTVYAVGSLGDQASASLTVSVPATLSFTNGTFSTVPGTLTGGAVTYFRAAEAVTFHLDSAAGTTLTSSPSTVSIGANGQTGSAFTVTVPSGIADGTHTVYAVGGAGSQATYAITVSVPSTMSITASQNLTSLPGTITGGAVTYFGASENVIIRLDSVTGTILATTPAPVTTGASGQASGFSVTVPAGIAAGAHTLVALGNTTGLTATSNSFTVGVPATFSITAAQSVPAGSLPASVSGGSVGYFAAGETLTIHLDTAGGTVLSPSPSPLTADSTGQASSFSMTIPAGTLGGSHTLWAVGTTSARTAQSNSFTVAASATGLSPTSRVVGSSASITAKGFLTSHALTVTVGGASASITSGATSDATGASTVSFTIPAVPNGSRSVVVSDGTSTATSATGFTVNAAATGLTPTSGTVGTAGVAITANGFLASTALTVKVGGNTASITSGGTTGTNGSSSVVFTIPATSNGSQPVIVSDGTNTATSGTNFTIQAALSVSPASGASGTTGVTLTGTGFVATKTVSVTFGGSALTVTPATVSATGGWTATFTVPSTTAGAKTVTATDSGSATASTTFTVTAASFTLASVSFGGSVNGAPETGDTMTLTFSANVKGTSVPASPTVTFSRASGSVHTFVTITGIFDGPVDTGGQGYFTSNGNKSFSFNSTTAVSGTTITITLGTKVPSGDSVGSGSSGSGTVSIPPATTITDASNHAASGTLTTSTNFAFF
jgi:hypothetical protein